MLMTTTSSLCTWKMYTVRHHENIFRGQGGISLRESSNCKCYNQIVTLDYVNYSFFRLMLQIISLIKLDLTKTESHLHAFLVLLTPPPEM